ncbi:MAG: hypothetical protein J6T17_08305 [Clostridia bacterium]|nr:hypothetical protein [Clostridia bacterium]
MLAILWAFGSIGGVLCLLLTGYWHIALGVAAVAAMAFPYVRKHFDNGRGE